MLENRRNIIIVASLLVSLVISFAFGSPLLPLDEVEGLKHMAETLGMKDLNFSQDSCGEHYVNCDCTYLNDTLCHITNINWSSKSLAGTLPSQLFRLPYLQSLKLQKNHLSGRIPSTLGHLVNLTSLDLSWNYLSGEIPRELGFTKLEELYLNGNGLTGFIPKEIGNITTLTTLNLEANHLSGRLPSALGNLVNLEIFVINDNNFEGQIPSSIKTWINVTSIRVQGSGLSGPLPSEIGLLTKLTKLIISDLNGASSPFPPLENLYNMEYLILRSCNIMDVLPDYLDVMENLALLDLSFNKISGQIPPTFYSLARVENIFLTGNLLNGSVPEWMLETGENIDLSYNKFKPLLSNGCQSRLTNLFSSSATDENSNLVSCLADHKPCSNYLYSLHINCGGKEVTINGTTFEGDVNPGQPSMFVSSKTNWGYSNTGLFLYDTDVSIDYIELNHSMKFPTPFSELYESARVSPISLTYYAYCLGNGNYTISLHFSEIVLTNDTKLGGHGRRIFHIYIQGKLVVKDFNIVDAAGGILKPVIKRIPVAITGNTIEIRFYWAGKGTFLTIEDNTGYGPLISAISIEPDFEPPSKGRKHLPVGAILGIIVAAIAFVIVSIFGILWWQGCLGRKTHSIKSLKQTENENEKQAEVVSMDMPSTNYSSTST